MTANQLNLKICVYNRCYLQILLKSKLSHRLVIQIKWNSMFKENIALNQLPIMKILL